MSEGFKLSYLYLDNYRTIEKAHISFDHRYVFKEKTDDGKRSRIETTTKHGLSGPYFYGNHIYSMSCIVGKNGEGKTSTVDFIHESFLLMLKHIGGGSLKLDAEHHQAIDFRNQKPFYHLEKDTKFLVIFSVKGEDCFLTNIPDIECGEELKPFTEEHSRLIDLDKYCTVYFSQMRFRTGVARSELQHGRSRDELALLQNGFYSEMDTNPYLTIEELFGRYKVDFSEERIDARRSAGGDLNFDILIQLAFIYLREDLVTKCLGADFTDRMKVNSINCEGGDRDNDIMLSDVIGNKDKAPNPGMIDEIVRDPRSYLRPFSSGQYTRFALLARLYWFLEGSRRFSDIKIFEDTAYYRTFEEGFLNRGIDDITGALLLFDEGDLFYHPEWQREYVGDIIDLVKTCAQEDMQIVFTTNSPFMLSDMLREDIYTLKRSSEDIGEGVLTFGQNIHTLLAHRFFLDNTIGRVSERVIGWLIQLLADPEAESIPGRAKKKDRYEEYKAQGLSKATAEAKYVNSAVYQEFEEYCRNQGLDEQSDKSEFLESLILSIGEEIYRKRLIYRFELYKTRISEKSVMIPEGDAAMLLNMLKGDPKYRENPAVVKLSESWKIKTDGSIE